MPKAIRHSLSVIGVFLAVGLASCGTERETQWPASFLSHFVLGSFPRRGFPAAYRRYLHGVLRWDVDWAIARRIPVNQSGQYWLVPGDAHLCIVAISGVSQPVGLVCATKYQALRHGVLYTKLDRRSDKRVMIGVVPGGVRTAAVWTGHSVSSAEVHDGVFVWRDSVMRPPDVVILH